MDLLQRHVEKLTLSPADKKTVQAVARRVQEIGEMTLCYQLPGRGRLKTARFAAASNPTPEAFAEIAAAVVAEAAADTVSLEVRKAAAAACDAQTATLAPIAEKLIAELDAALDADLEAHKKTVQASPLAAIEGTRAAEAAVAVARAHLGRMRERLPNGALAVIGELGLAD